MEYFGAAPGAESLGGVMVDAPRPMEWGLSQTRRGPDSFLVLERLLRRDANGHPFWRAVATVRAPHVPAGYALMFATCMTTNRQDPAIFAIVKNEDKPFFDRVLAAWRIDTSKQEFVSLPLKGVRCENEVFGDH